MADPLGEEGTGETSPALPCINSSAVHWPGGSALVEPFMTANRITMSRAGTDMLCVCVKSRRAVVAF